MDTIRSHTSCLARYAATRLAALRHASNGARVVRLYGWGHLQPVTCEDERGREYERAGQGDGGVAEYKPTAPGGDGGAAEYERSGRGDGGVVEYERSGPGGGGGAREYLQSGSCSEGQVVGPSGRLMHEAGQGPTITFNLRNDDGAWVGYSEVCVRGAWGF
jgi:hypothetical protein